MKTREWKIENRDWEAGNGLAFSRECGERWPSRRYVQMYYFLILCTLFCFRASAQSYSVAWYKIAGGGGTSTNGTYQVSGTVGQHDADRPLSGGNYSVTGGFWAVVSVVQMPGVPDLTITHPGNSVVVSWPDTGSYTLQQNSSLASGTWVTSGYSVTTSSGTNSITITVPTGNLFFRLKQ